jgi:hypothetical protein
MSSGEEEDRKDASRMAERSGEESDVDRVWSLARTEGRLHWRVRGWKQSVR